MNDPSNLQVICLTPVKDEAWILERFLDCASQWADHILIADQQSGDQSRQITRRYPKVHLLDNAGPAYDEAQRQALLIEAARRLVPGRRLLIALDADEMLTANWRSSSEWRAVCQAPPGTSVWFEWINLRPDLRSCWLTGIHRPFGFLDDGASRHQGTQIHSARVPTPDTHPPLKLDNIKVLHYQYTDWDRMKSKHRWYQCWESLNDPNKSPIDIYRMYHHMDVVPSEHIRPLCREWLAGYEAEGIDMTTVHCQAYYRWDKQVLSLLAEHGARRFRKLAIWAPNWLDLCCKTGFVGASPETFRDPRTPFEKAVHRWLKQTQPDPLRRTVRFVEHWLRWSGW